MSEGVSRAEVLRRQAEEGFNELPSSRPRRLRHFVIEVVSEPMVFLIVACGVIYLFLGDRQEALMLLGFLFVILGITVTQERKAERAFEALRDLSSPRALVLREGKRLRIPGREVVREDLVFVNEGDRVPADGVLLSDSILRVDESLLTGESVPVEKPQGASLYAGTTVVHGQGVLRVTAIGIRTELGKIGKAIQLSSREPTHLETETRKLVRNLAWIAGLLCVLVVILYGLTRGNWLGGFLAGLTLAMAILPNELPAVLAIFLALGAWRISQRRVLTRKMPAIENLGAATVLCVDKTGTLTLNRMAIQKLVAGGKTLDLSGSASLPHEFHELVEYGILACRQDPFDPMERAFLEAGSHFLEGTEHLHKDWSLKKEYPLSPELLSISHAWKSRREGEYVIGAKGAPEAIIELCHLDAARAAAIGADAEKMAREGLRVIGVAKAHMSAAPLPGKQHDFDFEFVGLVGLADPIRPEVPGAIDECRAAGIRVVMITGDHPETASAIARRIGLQNPEQVITGQQLKQMDDDALAQAVRQVSVFSRMVPEQKLRLVQALKRNGEVVAMTGDGVNDAPALKNADIGIAMGARGTDVARESAAIVLLDDDFGSIVEAIRMGRRVYTNLQGAMVYLMAVHVPIAGMSILPVALKLPLVLLPVHIAFLHLIIEPACSIAFEAEPAGPMTLRRPPRNPRDPLFSRRLFGPSFAQGVSVLIALLAVYMVALYRGAGEEEGRAMAFTALIISNLVLIYTSRESGLYKANRTLAWIVGGAVVFLALVLFVPQLRHSFRFAPLDAADLALCLLVGVVSVIWLNFFRKPLDGETRAP